jgi:membrane protease YdiL (CAAX protease family)
MTDAPVSEPTRPIAWHGAFRDQLTRLEAGRWLLLAFAGFIAGQVVSALAVEIVARLLGHGSELSALAHSSAPPSWFVATSILGLWVGFLGAPYLAVRYASPIRRRFGLSFEPKDLLGIAIGLGLQIAIGVLYSPFRSHLKHFDAPITKLTGSSHGAGYVFIFLLTIFGAPVVEEIFFRGLLLRSLVGFAASARGARARKVALAGAVVADGLLFAASHGELVQLPGLALVGIVLSICFLRTGRLGLSMVTHMTFNAVAIISYTASSGLVLWLH